MTTHKTGNVLGSTAAKDLYDNAENLDEAVNSGDEIWVDRLGKSRRTLTGIDRDANRAMLDYGYITKKSFELGYTISTSNQVLLSESDGEYYRWDGPLPKIVPAGSTPESTGGVGDHAWKSVGDATLRTSLSSGDGFGNIGGATYEQIRASNSAMSRAYCIGKDNLFDGAYGFFEVDCSDTTSADNGGTILVDVQGRRWKRQFSGNVSADWFCVGDGINDDTAAMIAALSLNKSLELNRAATYKLSENIRVNLSVQSFYGNGAELDFSSIIDGGIALALVNDPVEFYGDEKDEGETPSIPNDLAYPSAVRHEITGLKIVGPGKAGSGAAYEMTSVGVQVHAPHLVMKNSLIYGFGYGVDIFTSGYVLAFENVNIFQNAVGVYAKSGGSNYGERISFVNCAIANNALGVDNRCITGVLSFTHTSIDYNLKTLSARDTAITELTGGSWIECLDAGEGKTHIDLKNGAVFTMIGGHIQQNGTPGGLLQNGFLNTESDCTATFTDVFMFNLANVNRLLDAGSGLVKCTGTKSYPVSYLPPRISNVANNLISDGGFTQSSLFDMWSVFLDSGTITSRTTGTNLTLSITTEQARSGTQCLKFNKLAGGVDGDAVLIVPAEPGSRVAATCWWKKIAQASSGGNVYVSTRAIKFHGLKSNGIPDVGSGITFDTFLIGGADAETDWQQIESGMDRIIPSWANAFEIYINATDFQGSLYFDDFNVSVM